MFFQKKLFFLRINSRNPLPFERKMSVRRIETSPRFSEAVVHNGVVYLSGQVPEEGSLRDAKTQMESILSQIDGLLARAGSNKSHLLSATVYLTSFDSYSAMNEAWEAWLPPGSAPARATIGNVTLAKKEWLIEIMVSAAVL